MDKKEQKETAELFLGCGVGALTIGLLILGFALWFDAAFIKTEIVALPTSEWINAEILKFLDFLPKAFAFSGLVASPFIVWAIGQTAIEWYFSDKRKNDEIAGGEK